MSLSSHLAPNVRAHLVRCTWLATSILPGAGRWIILWLIDKRGLPADEFAALINVASIAGVYISASFGVAMLAGKQLSISGSVIAIAPLLVAAIYYNYGGWPLSYVAFFCLYQVYRYVKFGDGVALAVVIVDVLFILSHCLLIVSGRYNVPSFVGAIAVACVYPAIYIYRQLRSLDVRDVADRWRYLMSGLSNLSTTGLVFIFPLVMGRMLGAQHIAGATIISVLSLSTVAVPRAFVSSHMKSASRLGSNAKIKAINARLLWLSLASFALASCLVAVSYVYTKSPLLCYYGLLVSGYTAVGQASSLNANILMIRGDFAWLFRWNVAILATVFAYYTLPLPQTAAGFLGGLVLTAVMYFWRGIRMVSKTTECLCVTGTEEPTYAEI